MKIAPLITQKRWFMTFGRVFKTSVSVTKRATFNHPTGMVDVVERLQTPRTAWDAGQSSLESEALYTIRNSAGDVEVQISLRQYAHDKTETIFTHALQVMYLVAVKRV